MATLHEAQQKLLRTWILGGGGLILLVTVQGLFGNYGERWEEAAKWIMAAIFPNAGVIVGAITYSAYQEVSATTVNPVAFRSAWWFSRLYLLIVLLVLLMEPLVRDAGPLEMMARANVILGPLQGLVGTALGAFFMSMQTGERPSPARTAAAD